jgi:ArsR family transcriptional regulator
MQADAGPVLGEDAGLDGPDAGLLGRGDHRGQQGPADPTRIQVLHLLATSGGPMTVGQIVQQLGVGQSTVSHHLKVLAQVRFVTVERAGTSSRYQVNPRCLAAFPTAADIIMGQTPAT